MIGGRGNSRRPRGRSARKPPWLVDEARLRVGARSVGGKRLLAERFLVSLASIESVAPAVSGVRYDHRVISSTFASFSQNGEDVVLWRALHDVPNGRYIDVGANDPQVFSVSMGFYNRGWSGITVEPDPAFAQMQRDQRPRDLVVEAAITSEDGGTTTFHVVDGTGLSTLDASLAQGHARAGFDTHDVEVTTRTLDSILKEAAWDGFDIHFMSIDTEGAEKDVLESIDLSVWRPWVLVVEATSPLTTQSTRGLWEDLVLDAGYSFCLFDGLSCFYVAEEQADSLIQALSYPACPLDDYTTREYRDTTRQYQDTTAKYLELVEQVQDIPVLVEQVTRWRSQAVNRWATAIATDTEVEKMRAESADLQRALEDFRAERADLHWQIGDLHRQVGELQREIGDLHQSSSWRVTRPLRFLGGLLAGRRRRL